MVCSGKRIPLRFVFAVVGLSAIPLIGYAQGCQLKAATLGKPSQCVAVSATGKCSPVDTGTDSTGMCVKVSDAEQCRCAPVPPTPIRAQIDKTIIRQPIQLIPRPIPVVEPPLTGFVDLHTHPLANLGFGGKLLYGGADVGSLLPSDPDCNNNVRAGSEAQALGHDKSTHGGHDFFSNKCGDEIRKAIIHEFQKANHGADPSEDALGYPSFNDWPVWNDLTHQKMWVEWIRRAHTGGLRVIVALAVNNKTLGDAVSGPGDYPTDDRTSADLQIAETKAFVSRHNDFMEVALSSADLKRINRANKLAVVLGVEVDNIGNLKPMPPPTNAALGQEIDRLFAEGVRYIFPIHVLDNALGGTATYEDIFNYSTFREEGHYWALGCAPAPANPSESIDYRFSHFSFLEISLLNIAAAVKLGTSFPNVPPYPPCGQTNTRGLTPQGQFAINKMMRLGMLIDLDHMSQVSADATLTMAKQFGYPINSGHSGLRGALPGSHNERALRADQYLTIGTLHGMAGVGSAGLTAPQWLTLYNQVIGAMGGGTIAGGFGTDTDGFALGMPPRAGPQLQQWVQCITGPPVLYAAVPCRQQFPNAFVSGVQYSSAFPASRDGNKTWDLRWDGVAHFGMLPDFLQDVKSLPGGATMIASFMTGADYFYHTWQIAETKSTTVR
jgi:microsomal dipeptidase-like Zn-dependent dipeptidase